MPPPRRRPAPPPDPFPARARGCLLGLAVGDALGAPLSGRRLRAPDFPELSPGLHREMRGGGPCSLERGQVTAPTQMAACLAASLRDLRVFDPPDVRRRYLLWLPHALAVDGHTKAVLEHPQPAFAARELWLRSGRRACGPDPLCRTAAAAVHIARDDEVRQRALLEDCALTHADPRCQLACVALGGALAAALTSRVAAQPPELVRAAELALARAAPVVGKALPEHVREVLEATDALRADLALAHEPDPRLYGPELHLHHTDSVRVTFRLAFWELLHATSLEAGLLDAVDRGGRTEVNGAVVGALLGALHGETAVPGDMTEAVLRALERTRGPLRAEYHPVQLLLLPAGS